MDRWKGIIIPYKKLDVDRLKGSIHIEYTLAKTLSMKLWNLLQEDGPTRALGALTGHQAVQMVKAGLKAIYISGWQVAADANLLGQTYPDQSLYPSNSVPCLVKRINSALVRASQIDFVEKGRNSIDYLIPSIADAEAGFGGPLHAFELMKQMIEAGAAGVHFEDQLASEKKCGHLGGKVLVPTSQFIKTLIAARLAADVLEVPTVLIARTDALSANLITTNIDEQDKEFLTGTRTSDGFYGISGGLKMAWKRGLAYAPYADLIWFETSKPDLKEAEEFASVIHSKYPGKLLAYNCSPSFNWKKYLNEQQIESFQSDLNKMGYKFQFITLAGFHSINHSMFDLARDYSRNGMSAYAELQEQEFDAQSVGYTAVKHQREAGTGYFDEVLKIITGDSSKSALEGSTEKEQF